MMPALAGSCNRRLRKKIDLSLFSAQKLSKIRITVRMHAKNKAFGRDKNDEKNPGLVMLFLVICHADRVCQRRRVLCFGQYADTFAENGHRLAERGIEVLHQKL